VTRRLVVLPDLPHRPICRFDVTPEAIRIEQRISETVGFKLTADGGELRRRKGEFQRECLIFLKIVAHKSVNPTACSRLAALAAPDASPLTSASLRKYRTISLPSPGSGQGTVAGQASTLEVVRIG
jgi:hypothetical protein